MKRRHRVRRRTLVAAGVAVVLGVVGGLLAGCAPDASPQVSSADPGSLGFDSQPFDPAALTASAEPPVSAETTPAELATTPEEKLTALTADAARDVVGRMLQAMHDGKADAAMALATERMRKTVNNDPTWFGPGPDVLISFEVRDAVDAGGGGLKVYCIEQWNSGPEKTAYTVILKDSRPMVDLIEWSDL